MFHCEYRSRSESLFWSKVKCERTPDSPEIPRWSVGTGLWPRWCAVSVPLTGWYPAPEGRQLYYKIHNKEIGLHPLMRVAAAPRVTKEIAAYFPYHWCMTKSNMTVVSPAPCTLTPSPVSTATTTNDAATQWELRRDLDSSVFNFWSFRMKRRMKAR